MSKTDAKSRIIRYLTKSDIVLTAEEETILARWEHIDLLDRQGKDYETILLAHTAKFSVSKFTTNADISAAQEVFGKSRKLNKRYLAHLHIGDLRKDLDLIRKEWLKIDPKSGELESSPDAKKVAALAKLHEALTYQINSLPEEIESANVPKPVIVFELVGQSVPEQNVMDIQQAIQLADQFINGLPEAQIIPDGDSGDK